MKWLAECSAAALHDALRVVAPDLSGYPVTVPGPAGKQDPQWHSGSEPLGHQFFVYVDAQSERVQILYRRRDGNFGMIEPVVGGMYTKGKGRPTDRSNGRH